MPEEGESQREPRAVDPDALAKALEAELIFKRAAWQRAAARRGTWRALSFLFLCVVILGALFAYFYLVPKLNHRGTDEPGVEAAQSSR
jgi:hypothetical protein